MVRLRKANLGPAPFSRLPLSISQLRPCNWPLFKPALTWNFCDFAGRDSPHRDGILRPLESPTFSGQQVLFEPVFLFLVQRQIDELDASL